jgi:hypothetical protein
MTTQPTPMHTVDDPRMLARHLTGSAQIDGHVHRLRADYVEATGEDHFAAEHEHEEALATDTEFHYQAEGPRAKSLTVTSRSATASAWGQARRLHGLSGNSVSTLVSGDAARTARRTVNRCGPGMWAASSSTVGFCGNISSIAWWLSSWASSITSTPGAKRSSSSATTSSIMFLVDAAGLWYVLTAGGLAVRREGLRSKGAGELAEPTVSEDTDCPWTLARNSRHLVDL